MPQDPRGALPTGSHPPRRAQSCPRRRARPQGTQCRSQQNGFLSPGLAQVGVARCTQTLPTSRDKGHWTPGPQAMSSHPPGPRAGRRDRQHAGGLGFGASEAVPPAWGTFTSSCASSAGVSCLASGILPEAAPDRRDRHEGHTGRVTAPGLPEEVPWALDGDPRVSASPENAQAASPLSPQVVSPQTHRCQDSLPGTTSAVRWASPSSSPTPGPGLLQGAGRGPTCRGPPAGHGLSFLTQARGRPPPGHMPRRYLGHRGQASLGRLPLAVCGCPGERPWASVAGREGGSGSAPAAAPLPPPESSGPATPVPPGLRVPLGLRSSALRARPESRVPAKHRGAAASPPPVLWLVGGGHLPEQGRWPGPSSLRCGARAAAVHGVPSGGGAGPEPLPTPAAGLAGASPLTCLNTQRAAGPGGHSAF